MRLLSFEPDKGLTIRAWGSLPSEKFQDTWIRIFRNWEQVLSRYSLATNGDRAWWWGERPSVSFLAAAVWCAGGVAIEEFRNIKGTFGKLFRGRADLYVALDGFSHVIEAKFDEVNLQNPDADSRCANRLRAAASDVSKVNEIARYRVGIAFLDLVHSPASPEQLARSIRSFQCLPLTGIGEIFSFGFRVDLFPVEIANVNVKNRTSVHAGTTMLLGFDELASSREPVALLVGNNSCGKSAHAAHMVQALLAQNARQDAQAPVIGPILLHALRGFEEKVNVQWPPGRLPSTEPEKQRKSIRRAPSRIRRK